LIGNLESKEFGVRAPVGP